MDVGQLRTVVDRINAERAASGQPAFAYKTVPQGAATSVWAAVVAVSSVQRMVLGYRSLR